MNYSKTLHALCLATSLLLTSCLEDIVNKKKDTPIEPLEYPSYYGSWSVDLNTSSVSRKSRTTKPKPTIETNELPSSPAEALADYHLEFYKLSDWNNYIKVSNSNYGNDMSELAFGDKINISFAVANTGSEMFSVYLGASKDAEISINWDGVNYDIQRIPQLQANYYNTISLPLENGYTVLDFSPGNHKIELVLDVPGQSTQTISRTVSISTPDIGAEVIELSNSYYFIENNGQISSGFINYSYGKMELSGFGTLKIKEEQDDIIIVSMEVSNGAGRTDGMSFDFALRRQANTIPDTDMTNLLCYDPWKLVETSSSISVLNTKWMFHRSGSYTFINTTTGNSRKYWGYDSETSIKYGLTASNLNGSSKILELTQNKLVIDDSFNTFTFER